MGEIVELKPYSHALYDVEEAKADGDCFYHAFIQKARDLKADIPETPKALRKALLQLPHLDADTVVRLRNREWAEDDEIQATALLTGICIFVWSTAQRLWFYHFPSEDNRRWSIDDCEKAVYIINVGDGEDQDDLQGSSFLLSEHKPGMHYDSLVPKVPFAELILGKSLEGDMKEGSTPEIETSEEEEEEELEIFDDELISLIDDDDEEPSYEEEQVGVIEGYHALSVPQKFAQVKKRLREYEDEMNFSRKYAKQLALLSLREDMDVDRLRNTPHHALTLDESPYDKEVFALTNNQRFLKRFLSPDSMNRGVLLFHGVGVGKTCSAVQIATNFSTFYTNRALVILPSSLEDNFRKELFNIERVDFERRSYDSCYGKRYLDRIPEWHMMSPVELNKLVQSMITEQFEFVGFLRLVNIVMKIHIDSNMRHKDRDLAKNDVATQIHQLFSNRVIVIDEVHNIRMGSESGRDAKAQKQFPQAFKKILKYATGVRLALLSATPMFNDVDEINWLMEILFKCDDLTYDIDPIAFNTKDLLSKDSKNTLKFFARNYVSFMRGQDPNTFPTRLENVGANVLREHPRKAIAGIRDIEPIRSFVLTESVMRSRQKSSYTELVNQDRYGKHIKQLEQISNIVYPTSDATPNAKYGFEAFKAMFDQKLNGKKQVALEYKEGFPKLTGAVLSRHACKIATILDHIKRAEGIVMVFSFYIYSGLLPMAIALEHAGYKKHGGSLLKDSDKTASKGSYIILTAKEGFSPDNSRQLRELNSPENMRGDRIKVVLVGQVGSEGLDLQCVREVHIMEPWYHMNKIEQIVGRAVRFRSHDRLPEEQRNVTIYRHVSTCGQRLVESLDYKNYRVSEAKMRRVQQVEEILSKYALDCPLNIVENNRRRLPDRKIVDSQGKTREPKEVVDPADIRCATRVDKARDVPRLSSAVSADLIALAKQIVSYIQESGAVYLSFQDRPGVPSLLRVPEFRDRGVILKGSMNWIVRTRASIVINDTRGRMLEIEGAYIYQPERVHDQKIPIRTRTLAPDERVRNFVISPPSSDEGVASEESLGVVSYEETIRTLEINVQNKQRELLDILGEGVKSQVVVDMMVDRLSSEELRAIISELGGKLRSDVRESIETSGMLLKKHPEVYFDYHYGFLRSLNGRKAGLMENDRVMKDFVKVVQKKRDAIGFVNTSKGKTNFKMINPDKNNKQVGSICVATSTIKKSDLVSFIGTQVGSEKLRSYEKLGKASLCSVYEYALRLTNPKEKHFLRPAIFEILSLEKN
jgi:hypothetical protein